MTAAEYRQRAAELLTPRPGFGPLTPEQVEQAGVWARLAVSAAISETTSGTAVQTTD